MIEVIKGLTKTTTNDASFRQSPDKSPTLPLRSFRPPRTSVDIEAASPHSPITPFSNHMVSTSKIGRRNCRIACQPCRQRKRKCDGSDPCQSCVRYEYQCYFTPREILEPHHFAKPVSGRHVSRGITSPPTPSSASASEDHRNIPITLHEQQQRERGTPSRNLGPNGPQGQPLKADSWNLGLRMNAALNKGIVDLVSYDDACRHAGVFFRTVHQVFRLVDQQAFTRTLRSRWLALSSRDHDAVIAGVIALGSLFSGAGAHPREDEICDIARRDLEALGKSQHISSTHNATRGWILRVLYLRMAHSPRSAWIAICSCITTIEEDGIHGATDAAKPMTICSRAATPSENDSDSHLRQEHARLHWTARMLHTWIYQDYAVPCTGRPVRNLPCASPEAEEPEDMLPSIIALYILSDEWCCHRTQKTLPGLTASLQKIKSLTLVNDHPVTQLFKSNHAFCIYRFMRLTGAVIPPSTLALVIQLTKPGLRAAARLAEDRQPWWHVVHLPFQFLCVMLCMDTRESLQEVEEAMTVLRHVELSFGTARVQSVINTAEALVAMCRARKLEAVSALSRSNLRESSAGKGQQSEAAVNLHSPTPAPFYEENSATPAGDVSGAWAADLDISGFSWDDFLDMEFPVNLA